ncbi:MAG TPA: NDP-sugar synthase [Pyrinomonadaceae bacterium]|jgi:NDP-sugar pyrophosphorylase family protein
MQALILAGGKGTRLRPLTVYTPKPIVPFLNRPFLLYQLEVLRRAGIENITLSLSYQPAKIEQILGDGSDFGVNLRFITEPSPMGTGGAYKYAAADLRETTVVFNGDILTDLDVGKVVEYHKSKEAAATIVLAPVENPAAYGLVETDEAGKVLRFREKPRPEELDAHAINTINAGIYVLEPEVLDLIPAGVNHSFEYNVFPDLLTAEKPFYAYILRENYWRDIGNPESYLAGHRDFLAGRVKGFEIERTAKAEVSHTALVDKNSFLDEDCIIKPGARIINSVIGRGVLVEEKAIVENSVVWSHTRVSNSAEIRGAVVGRSCHIGKNAVVSEGAVLGDKTTLTDYTKT